MSGYLDAALVNSYAFFKAPALWKERRVWFVISRNKAKLKKIQVLKALHSCSILATK